MGILRAAGSSLSSILADQWQDIITASDFDEHTVVVPGKKLRSRSGHGSNNGLDGIISNGSVIFVPENTVAIVLNQQGLENVITESGGFEFRGGTSTVFDSEDRAEKGLLGSLFGGTGDRIAHGGMPAEQWKVVYVNMRELRGIKFGTRGPLAYNDLFYQTDLEVHSYGSFSVRVTDPVALLRNFVPPNMPYYSLDAAAAKKQLTAEFLHSFIASVNALSATYRISQLPSRADEIAEQIEGSTKNAGSWPSRFGLRLVSVAIENIEFSDDSRELVREFSRKRMSVRAYEDVSQIAGNMAAQQTIAEGVREKGFGEGGGMVMGMGFAGGINPLNASVTPTAASAPAVSPASDLDSQIETLKKLKELLDAGILSEEEFAAKKKQLLGL